MYRRVCPRSATGSFSPHGASLLRSLGVWLLAGLISLQGLTAGIVTTLGPAHLHAAAPGTIILVDVRRSRLAFIESQAHAPAISHSHGADGIERHHHRHDDVSVVAIDGSGAERAGDGEELAVSPTLAAFVALLAGAVAVTAAAENDVPAAPGWPSLTHEPYPLEHPPRKA